MTKFNKKGIYLLILWLLSPNLLAQGNQFTGLEKAQSCVACHGVAGNATVSQWPKLAGQNENYFLMQMHDFKNPDSGRANPIMQGIVAPLTQQDLLDLSAYFAHQTTEIGGVDPKLLSRGQNLYRGGDLQKQIPACSACHGPKGEGIASAAIPKLSGQNTEYVVLQLQAFANGSRKNDLNNMMQNIAAKLSPEDSQAVASYVNGLH